MKMFEPDYGLIILAIVMGTSILMMLMELIY